MVGEVLQPISYCACAKRWRTGCCCIELLAQYPLQRISERTRHDKAVPAGMLGVDHGLAFWAISLDQAKTTTESKCEETEFLYSKSKPGTRLRFLFIVLSHTYCTSLL